MNSITQYIMGIYQINMIVRDTLGYVAPRKENKYNKDIYNHRAQSLELLTALGSPFAHFLSINEEKATKLIDNIKEFKTDIYSPESRIFRVVNDGIEVDHSQHLHVYEMAIGIYQTIQDILVGYLNFAKTQEQLEKRIEDVIAADEYYFRALSHYALINDIFKLFKEYSEAMRSHNGEPNPVAKFINEDINKLTQLIAFQEKHNQVKSAIYKKMTDQVNAFIENMSGRRELPEGKNFPDIFNELNDFSLKTLQEAETKWRELFMPIAREYQEEMKKQQERKNPEDLA